VPMMAEAKPTVVMAPVPAPMAVLATLSLLKS